MSDRKLAAIALLAAGAGAFLAWRLASRRQVPHLGRWQRQAAPVLGQREAARLAAEARARYGALHRHRPQLGDRVLQYHLDHVVLPAVSLYQTLLANGMERDEALEQVGAAVRSFVAPLRRLVPALRFVPQPLRLLRSATMLVNRLVFPPQGWQMEVVEDNEEGFGFDMRRCFYLEQFTAYGAPELTASFCQADDILFSALPPVLAWERTGTMGRGAPKCDFRWRLRAETEGMR